MNGISVPRKETPQGYLTSSPGEGTVRGPVHEPGRGSHQTQSLLAP